MSCCNKIWHARLRVERLVANQTDALLWSMVLALVCIKSRCARKVRNAGGVSQEMVDRDLIPSAGRIGKIGLDRHIQIELSSFL